MIKRNKYNTNHVIRNLLKKNLIFEMSMLHTYIWKDKIWKNHKLIGLKIALPYQVIDIFISRRDGNTQNDNTL
jgi:hypothetical protein